LLLQNFWWGSVFLINLPIVVIALIAGRRLVPTSRDPSSPKLDPAGTVLSVIGLVGVLYAIIEGPSYGWTSTGVLAAFAVGISVIAVFIWWERRSDHPMLDMRFFRNARFSAASVAVAMVFFALFGTLFFLTQYLQDVLGYSALRAGLSFAPVAATMMIAAPSSARLTARFGTKVVVTGGMTVAAAALLLLSQATVTSGYTLVGIALALLGAGIGTSMAPATDAIMGSLPLAKAGVGSAVNDTTRQVGGALGVAILGSITNSVYRSHVATSAAVSALPAAARTTVGNGIGNALGVAQGLGTPAGAGVATDAKVAFVHAMQLTAYVGVAFALAGAVVAFLWLPSRPKGDPAPDPAEDPTAGESVLVGAGTVSR
jgi:EmrB/QacA subfamily drug resistance transporter